jgi:putative acetyltransferase
VDELVIRAEEPGDIATVRAVNDAAFGRPVEGQIVDDIRGTARWIPGGSLVAVTKNGAIVGHLLLSEGDLMGSDGRLVRRIWMLGPVAVRPDQQRRGVGSALMRAAIDLATQRGEPLLVLLGHATYYPRFGFSSARAIGIEPPQPWGDEHWMALRLPGWDATLRGKANYSQAFPED